MIGIGTPSSHKSIERPMTGFLSFQISVRSLDSFVRPGAFTQATAFGRGEGGGKRAEQH
jgi:hypothetical protein